MKTKMHVLKSTDDKGTTTIISIPGCAASGVLKSLHENKLPCDYMGLDQSGRILMEVNFDENHDKLMKEINEYIKQSEEISHAISQSLEELMEKKSEEIDQMLAEHKKKCEERRKRSTAIKNQENGNK